jgi:NADPH2:quinone reductase
MKAIRQHELGPAEVLRLEEVPDLDPGDGQVRIAVTAAGVHVVDTTIRTGQGPFGSPDLPMTPGREVAGVVDALGVGVDRRWLGRRVVAHLGMASGGYAEQAVAAVGSLHEVPDGVGDAEAVALIGTGRTTLAILDQAALEPGDVVLVTAAAGGIGTLLVQAARHAGATAVGLASAAKLDAVDAEVRVAYDRPGWEDEVRVALGERQPTVGFDAVGGELGRGVLDLLGPGGRFVAYGWAPGAAPTAVDQDDLWARSLTVSVAIGPRLQRLGLRPFEERALGEGAAGRWRPAVQVFPLADAAQAHRAIEERATTGKVVLSPPG